MLGVVNKAIEAFVCQRYGDKLWADLLIALSLPGYEFEAMLNYEDGSILSQSPCEAQLNAIA